MHHSFDVNTASCNIACNQNWIFPLLKTDQCIFAFALCAVAMDGGDGKLVVVQKIVYIIALSFPINEYQCPR